MKIPVQHKRSKRNALRKLNYCFSLEFTVDKGNVYLPDTLNSLSSPERKKAV